ncbi:TAT-binding protein-like protein 7, AAA ATPase, partial [Coemansia sp. RSA 2599]
MRNEETADSEDSPDDEEYTDNEVVAEEEQDREDGDSEASVSTRSHRHSQPNSAASSSDSEAETSESDGTTTVAAGTTETAASAGPDDNEDSRPIGKRLRKRSNINYAADSSFIDVNNDSQEPASSSSSSDGEPTGITAKLGRTLRPRRPRVLHTDGESTATASPRSTSHSESAASTPGRTSRRRSDRPKAMTDGERNEQLRLILELAEKCANSLAQQSQKQSPIKYNLRDRDKTKSYYIPMPQMSPSPSPSPQKNTQSGKVPAADVASTRASCRGRTPQPAASSAGENEAGRGEGQAAGNDELELILPMNLLELGPERCRRAGYVNDELFAGQTAAGAQHVSFEDIGGLDDYIESLKEMTVLPLLYPEIYSSFGIKPPRGVLFHGPPGTGKTLMARALAQSCVGQGGMEPIAFFMRRGADCLSKWVGEAERQLRHLFEQARAFQPSIIFFDELDGLAPVRSSRQDQVHASIVATLLSLMDGIDDRGQVVVIGATNRPDAIDAALRRPGRFDREMLFRLPNAPARERILRIHTRRWTTPLSDKMVADIVERTQGWGGADLSALCTEAALASVRRVAPRIYSSDSRVTVDVGAFSVQSRDVDEAMRRIVPSTRRSGRVGSQALPRTLEPLLGDLCRGAAHHLCQILEDPAPPCMPRMAVCGAAHMNVEAVGAAIAHAVESKEIPVFVISVQEMFGLTDGSPAQYITRVFAEAQRSQPSLVVIPMVNSLADIVDSRDIELLDACVSALKTQQRIGVLVSASCWMDPDGGRDKLWTSAMPGFA